ncbi:hypothetical protein [Pseudalkalibacillus berkeleyi]|nr:hypothetical protein [Pseudalkalibacillus berkeleyi]
MNRAFLTIATTCASAYLIKSLYDNGTISNKKVKRLRKRIAKAIY